LKLYKDGVTIDVTPNEAGRYLRLGYKEVGEVAAEEAATEKPDEKPKKKGGE